MRALKKLRRYMLYSGLEEEQWRKVLPLVVAENSGKLLLGAIVAALYYGACLIGSFGIDAMADKQLVYLFGTVVPLIVLVLHFTVSKGMGKPQNWLITFLSFGILASGLLSTLICTPNELTVLLLIFFFCIGMLFVWHPGALVGIVVLTDALYFIFAPLCKAPALLVIDLIDVFVFSTLSLILSLNLGRERYRRYWLEYSASALAELRYKTAYTDLLTETLNRSAYEREIDALESGPIPSDLAYMALDVNGLKQANDTMGHLAGDQLLIGTAECLRSCFQDLGRVFRVGGDEFVVILHAADEQREAALAAFEQSLSEWPTEDGLELSVSYGIVGGEETRNMTIKDIISLADKRMYQAKSNHYRSKSQDRRSRREGEAVLAALYSRVYKLDLTEETFRIIYQDPNDPAPAQDHSASFPVWTKAVVNEGKIQPEDLPELQEKMNLSFLREAFRQPNASLKLNYRRLRSGELCSTEMEVVPADDYSDTHQTLFLLVRTSPAGEEEEKSR